MPGVWRQGFRLPLWRPLLRGLQGKSQPLLSFCCRRQGFTSPFLSRKRNYPEPKHTPSTTLCVFYESRELRTFSSNGAKKKVEGRLRSVSTSGALFFSNPCSSRCSRDCGREGGEDRVLANKWAIGLRPQKIPPRWMIVR